jgi:predicted site-specific integrase-resolvase
MQGNVDEIVVAYRDRLCRFGYEIFEFLFKKYGTKLVVLNHKDCSKEEEMVQDLLSIVTVFSCRTNGLRKYKNQIQRDIEDKTQQKSKDEEKKENS